MGSRAFSLTDCVFGDTGRTLKLRLKQQLRSFNLSWKLKPCLTSGLSLNCGLTDHRLRFLETRSCLFVSSRCCEDSSIAEQKKEKFPQQQTSESESRARDERTCSV